MLVHIQPGASSSAVAGMHGDRLRIRIQAPPVDGRANQALERFLAEQLEVAPSRVRVVAGITSRRKTVEVSGVDVARARQALLG